MSFWAGLIHGWPVTLAGKVNWLHDPLHQQASRLFVYLANGLRALFRKCILYTWLYPSWFS
jgi:hypothetical protein